MTKVLVKAAPLPGVRREGGFEAVGSDLGLAVVPHLDLLQPLRCSGWVWGTT